MSTLGVDAAWAQLEQEEIVVYARKREETLLDAPLAITAMSAEDIQRFAYRDVASIADQTPELIINVNAAATAGAIALRGVSSGTFGSDLDQAVSMNVDGVVQSRAITLVSGFFDINQIEILKGPQALYFGKNSPGGIISFRSADPGEEFETRVGAGYEMEMRQTYVDGVVSGPITENWGARLAVKYLDQDGNYENQLDNEKWDRLENIEDKFMRLTLTGDVTENLKLRGKLAITETDSSGNFGSNQTYFCPNTPAPGDQCKLDDDVRSQTDPRVSGYGPWAEFYRDGTNFQDLSSTLASLEAVYNFGKLTLTSITGWNEWERDFQSNDPNNLIPAFLSGNGYKYDAISEEIRLASNFDGPFQFMLGGFLQEIDSHVVGTGYFYDPLASAASKLDKTQTVYFWYLGTQSDVDTDARSAFAQASYDITSTVNLSYGVRYSEEDKKADKFHNSCYPPVYAGIFVPLNATNCVFFYPAGMQELDGEERNSDNWSPEFTVRWQPGDDVTVYASYKQGFKSGGFNLTFTPTPNPSFDEETVDGVEAGVKAKLFDRQLRVDWAIYSYDYTNLQVSSFDPVTHTIDIFNAAEASVEGSELGLTWSPAAVSGLQLSAQLAYNKAQYEDYFAPCYVGQTVAQGCNSVANASGAFTVQDLGGEDLNYAPELGATFAANYEGALGDTSMRYALAASAAYTDEYMAHDKFNPEAVQSDAWRYNASARLIGADDRWDVALVGRNLSDERSVTYTQEVTGTGSGTGTAAGVSANLSAFPSMPRTYALEAHYRF